MPTVASTPLNGSPAIIPRASAGAQTISPAAGTRPRQATVSSSPGIPATRSSAHPGNPSDTATEPPAPPGSAAVRRLPAPPPPIRRPSARRSGLGAPRESISGVSRRSRGETAPGRRGRALCGRPDEAERPADRVVKRFLKPVMNARWTNSHISQPRKPETRMPWKLTIARRRETAAMLPRSR